MTCHLHELMEAIKNDEERYNEWMPQNAMEWVAELTLGGANDVMCFDAGNVEDVLNFKFIASLFKLPYNPVWIEMSNTKNGELFVFGYMIFMLGDNKPVILGWRRHRSEWRHMATLHLLEEDFTSGARIIHPPFEGIEDSQGYLRTSAFHVGCFLSALNCVNVRRVETVPDVKLQKARARRGKQPLFSYWTLQLALPTAGRQKENGGGTHSPPRLHLCRGHIKKRKTGYFWWQPHVRGNKERGIVHKDYTAKYTSPPTP